MTGQRCTRLVVKVGTSTLTDADGHLDRSFILDLTRQLAVVRSAGVEVALVSSGAIRAGKDALSARKSDTECAGSLLSPRISTDSLPYKQAAAAIGQGRLMHTYTEAFSAQQTDCAQILLTREDLGDRRRFLNARNTLITLLSLGVVPVVNENDTVAVDEIKFGDNDNLAALVATLIDADLLLILSDVDGLYPSPPGSGDEDAMLPIPIVARIDETISSLGGASLSGVGTGGMRTKIDAARIATGAGIHTIIARGRRENVICDVASGQAVGTAFLPRADVDRLPARKRWIAHTPRARGSVTVNKCARERLCSQGVSLLAVGIVAVSGSFAAGDLIEVRDETGEAFARGLVNYPSGEVRRLQGRRSEQFEEILGYRGFEEVIHRDNMVVGEA